MGSKTDGGAPKVQIETTGAFGQSTVRQISLDTNRPDLHGEFLFRFGNAIALPTRGLYTDAALWVLSVASPLRLVYSAVTGGLFGPGVGVVLLYAAGLPLVIAALAVGAQLPSHRPAVFYRFSLAALGVFLAVI